MICDRVAEKNCIPLSKKTIGNFSNLGPKPQSLLPIMIGICEVTHERLHSP